VGGTRGRWRGSAGAGAGVARSCAGGSWGGGREGGVVVAVGVDHTGLTRGDNLIGWYGLVDRCTVLCCRGREGRVVDSDGGGRGTGRGRGGVVRCGHRRTGRGRAHGVDSGGRNSELVWQDGGG